LPRRFASNDFFDLVAAQHMEGGPEASLYLHSGDCEFAGMGSYETGFTENDNN
jgi:hypothetical protein